MYADAAGEKPSPVLRLRLLRHRVTAATVPVARGW